MIPYLFNFYLHSDTLYFESNRTCTNGIYILIRIFRQRLRLKTITIKKPNDPGPVIITETYSYILTEGIIRFKSLIVELCS
jgi:hypothetical protein